MGVDFADEHRARYVIVKEWWTGFTKRTVREALADLSGDLSSVHVDGLDDEHLIMNGDLERLQSVAEDNDGYNALLTCLDPYSMGYG